MNSKDWKPEQSGSRAPQREASRASLDQKVRGEDDIFIQLFLKKVLA